MKQFRDLEIVGVPHDLAAFVETVAAGLPEGWRRDLEEEAREDLPVLLSAQFCFARDIEPDVRLALVSLPETPGRLYVPNIVPQKVTAQISMDEYNAALGEFEEIIRSNLPSDDSLKINMTSEEADIADWLSLEAVSALKTFSQNANKTVVHPLDSERWRQFLIRAHREDAPLKAGFLERWLHEELRWPEDKAFDLCRQYLQARELLKDYDGAGDSL